MTEESADGEGGGLTVEGSLLIDVGEVDLDSGVILGSDQAVGSRAGGEEGEVKRLAFVFESSYGLSMSTRLPKCRFLRYYGTYHLRGM